MIYVVNKRVYTPTKDDIYIGRPSILGNPWTHMKGTVASFVVETREEAIANYLPYLRDMYLKDKEVKSLLNSLVRKHREGKNIYLVCWCAPKSCHGDILKHAIEKVAEAQECHE